MNLIALLFIIIVYALCWWACYKLADAPDGKTFWEHPGMWLLVSLAASGLTYGIVETLHWLVGKL